MVSMNDTKLIEALSNASSLELFELSNIIDRLLADPRRIVAIRNKLNLGKSVQFMDWRTGQMRSGKVVAMKDSQVTVTAPADATAKLAAKAKKHTTVKHKKAKAAKAAASAAKAETAPAK